ncbi:MAG: GDSL family lipase [Proteobacteria bacterium]|nr:GDSL family lipase [Pseudomonadota bacterium]
MLRPPRTVRVACALAASALLLAAGVVHASTAASASAAPAPDAAAADPWAGAFATFDLADQSAPPAPGGILFVGSSSIRLWSDLDRQFAGTPVLNRGFGGSQLSDCVRHLNRLVIRYRPRTVFVYAGDNDLAAGATPEEVARRFARFVAGVRATLPATRIDYISIKPSPARLALLPQIRATNALIRDYVATEDGLAYVDVYSAMVDAGGQPRAELFRADALHLNATGYALWKDVIGPYVR